MIFFHPQLFQLHLNKMRSSLFLFIFVITLITLTGIEARSGVSKRAAVPTSQIVYPKVHRVNKTWSYESAKAKGNVTYSDPYFWLEGDASEQDIEQFVKDQNAVTEEYVKGCKGKDAITKSLIQASTYDKYKWVQQITPINKNDEPFYVYSHTFSSDQAPVWYTASMKEWQSGKETNFHTPPGKPFLNESLLSEDGSQSISFPSYSPDGKVFAYLVTGNGQDGTWYFRQFDAPLLQAKTMPAGGEGRLKDILPFSADIPASLPNGKGIFYPKSVDTDAVTNSDLGYKIQYHEFGTDNSKDITIFDAANAGPHGQDSFYFIHLSP